MFYETTVYNIIIFDVKAKINVFKKDSERQFYTIKGAYYVKFSNACLKD